MACSSCGGGRASSARKGTRTAKGIVSRSNKLPWAHVSPRGAVARYKTENEAKAAAKMFGGTAEKRND